MDQVAGGWENAAGGQREPLHPEPLVRRDFPRALRGRRGYDETAVDRFVTQAMDRLTDQRSEIGDLRGEVDWLHTYIRRRWTEEAATPEPAAPSTSAPAASSPATSSPATSSPATSSPATSPPPGTPVEQAHAVLARASELARRHVAEAQARLDEAQAKLDGAQVQAAHRLSSADAIADEVLAEAGRRAAYRLSHAEEQARRAIVTARVRYESVLQRAHRRAEQAAETALHNYDVRAMLSDDPIRASAELELKARYLRTFATVSEAALRAALEVTGREFDELLAELSGPAGAQIPGPDTVPIPTQHATVTMPEEEFPDGMEGTVWSGPVSPAIGVTVVPLPGASSDPQSLPAAFRAR